MIQTIYWLVENYATIQKLANFGGVGWGGGGQGQIVNILSVKAIWSVLQALDSAITAQKQPG